MICDVLGALAVMVTSAPCNLFRMGLYGDLKVSCWKLIPKKKISSLEYKITFNEGLILLTSSLV